MAAGGPERNFTLYPSAAACTSTRRRCRCRCRRRCRTRTAHEVIRVLVPRRPHYRCYGAQGCVRVPTTTRSYCHDRHTSTAACTAAAPDFSSAASGTLVPLALGALAPAAAAVASFDAGVVVPQKPRRMHLFCSCGSSRPRPFVSPGTRNKLLATLGDDSEVRVENLPRIRSTLPNAPHPSNSIIPMILGIHYWHNANHHYYRYLIFPE